MPLDLSSLNEVQKKAVIHTEGPCVIMAGPGSGKTRVLTYRVAYLVEEKKIPPYRIMVLTFTKKAANAMKEKLVELIGDKTRQLWIGTFHSVFCRILRREAPNIGFTRDFSIYDTEDSKSLLKRIVYELKLKNNFYKAEIMLHRISKAKAQFLTAKEYAQDSAWQEEDIMQKIPHFKTVYTHYEGRCKGANAMDYNDLLLHTYFLFKRNPTVLEKYRGFFDYLLVDEFQDTDKVQYTVLQQLMEPQRNLCVIGDAAQGIYAFRNAEIHNILFFNRRFPNCTIFRLEQNYRSTKHIVANANNLIKHSAIQDNKTLFTDNEQGEPVLLCSMLNEQEEAYFVADNVQQVVQKGVYTYDDFAVLYRSNKQSRILEEAFIKKNIPYQVIGNISFYQRKEIKDMLAYLHIIVNRDNEEALQRAINQPKRNIGPKTFEKIKEYAQQHGCTTWEAMCRALQWMQGMTAKRVQAFTELIEEHRALVPTKDAYFLAESIAKQSGLLAMLSQDGSVEGETRCSNVQELLDSIRLFCGTNSAKNNLADFLEEVVLLTGKDEQDKSANPKVKLITVHKAKGLEFPYVYIVGMDEMVFPSTFSLYSAKAIEEERRLFFVGITRAKKHLTITYNEHRYRSGAIVQSQPSRFLSELSATNLVCNEGAATMMNYPTKAMLLSRGGNRKTPLVNLPGDTTRMNEELFKVGKQVVHAVFGKGCIVALHEHGKHKKVVVDFIERGKKTLLLAYAKLSLA